MGEFNSDDHYIYYGGQDSLRRNGVAIIVNKRVQNVVLGCSLKNDRMTSFYFQGKPFSLEAVSIYVLTNSTRGFTFLHIFSYFLFVNFLMMAILNSVK